MTHQQAVRDFLADCKALGLRPEWAALGTAEIYQLHTVRQIRRVRNVLAVAVEPILDNRVVLTTDRRVLNLTPQEFAEFNEVPTKNQ